VVTRGRRGTGKKVEQYQHKRAERMNNPPVKTILENRGSWGLAPRLVSTPGLPVLPAGLTPIKPSTT